MNRLGRCTCLLSVLCLWFAGPVSAAEYWVASNGQDANAGTQSAPWVTLKKATTVAGPGDTVYLRAGTYRETLRPTKSGEPGKPVRFVGAAGERPILSGADPLTGTWQLHQGSIYKLQTNLKFIQLFVDGQMMPEARWPNTPPGELMNYNRAAAAEGTDYEVLADSNLPSGDWNGGIVMAWPGSRWISMTRRITDYQPGKSLRFDLTTEQHNKDSFHQTDPYKPQAGNPYLLIGSLAGLDSPGEWFFDEKTSTVYLWTLDSQSPVSHKVTLKQRDHAVDVSKLSFIEIKGFDIIGAAVNMADAQSCVVEECRLRYVEHVREWPSGIFPPIRNVITGKGNEWRKCLITGAATAGLEIGGEDNRFTNSIIHDVNYAGSRRGGLDMSRSVGAVASHCTISRTGRDGILHNSSKRFRIEYCDIFQTNLLNNDAGAIYAWKTDGEGGIIAYNWVHDNTGENTVGIYLDNFNKNFIVHHNLVWNCSGSGIRLNSDAINHLVANNTIQQVREPFGTYCYSGQTPTMKGTQILNNLVNEPMNLEDPGQFVQGSLGPEMSHCAPGAVDQNGYPVERSSAVDSGVKIAGITDNFQGNAPDLGAYEFSGPRWTAGAQWKDRDAPTLPARDLSYMPHPPITEKTMITEGLALWLDAADQDTIDITAEGTVTAWRDKLAAKRVALPRSSSGSVKWVADALNGKATVRGDGIGSLQVEDVRGELKPILVFVVSQSLEPRGPAWQRVIASFDGNGKEWELPNWSINAPGGKTPAKWQPTLFQTQQRDGVALGEITVFGSSAAQSQNLGGDISEVLIFDRSLRFDETEAVTKYLNKKWGLK